MASFSHYASIHRAAWWPEGSQHTIEDENDRLGWTLLQHCRDCSPYGTHRHTLLT